MLDEFRSTYITWDKATRRIYSPITANESDSNGRKLNIQVVNSGQVENLTSATLHLYWETKDKAQHGLDAFTASDISRGEFEIFYTTGMLSNVGELNATLVLVDATGQVVSDWFKITVARGIDGDAIQSENSFTTLTQSLIDISNLEQNYAPRLNDLTAQLQQMVINVKAFGAVGDGITDDGPAIKAAHQYAQSVKGRLLYPKSRYYISEVSEIPIMEDVDFGGSTIIINDNPNADRTLPLFKVIEENPPTIHENNSLTTAIANKVKKKTRSIPELAGNGVAFVEIYDSNDLILQRYGDFLGGGARAKADSIIIDNEGNLLNDVTYNFNNVTKLIIHQIPKNQLKLTNGHFISKGNNVGSTNSYYRRNIVITRSNVLLDNINHSIDNDFAEKEPSHGFIRTEYCANIIYKNSNLQPRLSNSSYELSNFMTANLTVDNVNAENDDPNVWGAHVGYYMKDAIFKNSSLNRIDSHLPSHNITIDNVRIGRRGLTLIGYGQLNIRKTSVHADAFLALREDYGSFWDGNIFMDEIDHYPLAVPKLILVRPTIDFDFGVETVLGRDRVYVNKYRLHDNHITSTVTPYLVYFDRDSTDKTPVRDYYKLGNNFSFNKCTADSGKGIAVFYMPMFKNLRALKVCNFKRGTDGSIRMIENITVELDGIKLDNSTRFPNPTSPNISNLIQPMNSAFNYNSVTEYALDFLAPKFIIKNCDQVYASVFGLRAILDIDSSRVNTLMNYNGGSNSVVTVKNSIIEPYFDNSKTEKYVIRTSWIKDTFINCTFLLPRSVAGRVFTSDKTQFIEVYSLFSGLLGTTKLSVGAKLIGCKLDPDFSLTSLNDKINEFNVNVGNMVDEYYYRKLGTTANRPTLPPYGLNYFDTTISKLIVYNGTNWIDSIGTSV